MLTLQEARKAGRQAGKASKRETILKAALKLFSRKGYHGATTKEIASRAKVAELTLFRYFSSKENLFEEVLRSYSFLPLLKGTLPELKELAYDEALAIVAERFLATLSARKDLIKILHSELNTYPKKVRAAHNGLLDEVFKTLASYFDELQRRGVLRDFDTEQAAVAFLGMFYSYFISMEFRLNNERWEFEVGKTIKEYIGFFMKGTLNETKK